MRPVAIGILVVLLVGCGGPPVPSTDVEPTASADRAPTEDAAPTELAVTVTRATVVGELAGEIAVESHPVGLLDPGGGTPALVTFAAPEGGEVHIPDYPFFSIGASAAEGTGRLGIAGFCGLGWRADGTPVEEDPCAAAEPVMGVPAGEAYTLEHRLYATTEDGEVAPGRYDASLPLAPGSTLEVTYEVVEHDPDTLPSWGPEDAVLTIGLEEVWLESPHRDELDVDIVVEDPYRREFARRAVGDIVADGHGDPPTWRLPLPAGTWTVAVVSHTANGPERCSAGDLVVEPHTEERTTVILDLHPDGRC